MKLIQTSKLKHRMKLRLARKLHPQKKNGIRFRGSIGMSIFATPEWFKLKDSINKKVEYREEVAKQNSIRKQLI